MREFTARRILAAGGSPTVALNSRGIAMQEAGRDILSFAAGEPCFDTPEAIKQAGIRAIQENNTHYTSAAGITALRERIARKLREENGIPAEANGIIVTPGAKLAMLQAILAFLEPGDEAMILTPAYPSYRSAILLAGAACVPVPLSFENGFRVTREMLETKASARTKMLIVCSPCNPTGHVLSEDEVADIAAFTAEHEILVLSDEIYETILFDGRKHLSLGAVPSIGDRVITINGLSKSVAMTGWRIGYSAAVPELTKAMMKLQSNTVNCTAAFTQIAAITAFDCVNEMRAMTEEYRRRRDFICDGLNAIPGVACPRSEGAFYAFFRIDHQNMTSEELADWILEETGILLVPGTAFGAGGEKCLRMSFAASMEKLDEALRRLQDLLS